MLPSQPSNCGPRWWNHPAWHSHPGGRFSWPSPATVAGRPAAAAAPGAAMAAPITATAEAAAAAHLAHAAGPGGPGGMPPGGYWRGYRGYGYGYRGFGRGRFFRRFFWFGLGAWVGVAWYKHRQQKKEEFHRYLAMAPPAHPNQPAGRSDLPNYIDNTPVDHTAAAKGVLDPSTDIKRWGWHDERRWGWRHACERRREAEAARRLAETEKPQAEAGHVLETAGGQSGSPIVTADTTDEMSKIKEAVERLWAEKKREAVSAQEIANERAKDFAREKLDKLSLALETLRESLKQDAAAKADKDDKKWV
ncbi:hypothetical protein IAU60_000109 [Kwoniella sp. DSM 27419]